MKPTRKYTHRQILRHASRTRAIGFTLLEMVVVLAIIATIAGVALPNFARMIESYEQKSTLGSVTSELGELSFKAYTQAKPMLLSPETARTLLPSLPTDWQVAIEAPVTIQANGFCSGGLATITARSGAAWQITLRAPLCTVEIK